VIWKPGGRGGFGELYGLNLTGVREWLFCPGMLFQSMGKWWGDRGSRNRPHEGLDLLLYRDQEERVLRLGEETPIPVMSDGVIVGIIQDFLGKSVIVEHPVHGRDDERHYIIYGHTRPQNGLCPGTAVRRGDVVGTVASPGRCGAFPMAPHLHISLAWAATPVSHGHFDWNTIGASELLTLLDPLSRMDFHYRLLGSEDPVCQGL